MDDFSPYRLLCATAQARGWTVAIHGHPAGPADSLTFDTLTVTDAPRGPYSVHLDDDTRLDEAATDLIASMIRAGVEGIR